MTDDRDDSAPAEIQDGDADLEITPAGFDDEPSGSAELGAGDTYADGGEGIVDISDVDDENPDSVKCDEGGEQ